MVLRCDVLGAAIDAAVPAGDTRPRLLMSPRGRPLAQAQVREWVAGEGVVIVCGRFEGVDERVIEGRGLTEVSIGDYILSGGEMAALVLLDACVRLIPGVMGKELSGEDESFENGLLEYPHYTRPREWEGRGLPEALLSGDHARIAKWRQAEAERITRERRPDLLLSFSRRFIALNTASTGASSSVPFFRIRPHAEGCAPDLGKAGLDDACLRPPRSAGGTASACRARALRVILGLDRSISGRVSAGTATRYPSPLWGGDGVGGVPLGERLPEWHQRCTPLRRTHPAFRPPTPSPLHKGEGFPAPLAQTATLLPFSRMGEGGAERRMRACRRSKQAPRLRRAPGIKGRPSPLPLSLISGLPEISTQSVEVGNSRLRCGRGVPRP